MSARDQANIERAATEFRRTWARSRREHNRMVRINLRYKNEASALKVHDMLKSALEAHSARRAKWPPIADGDLSRTTPVDSSIQRSAPIDTTKVNAQPKPLKAICRCVDYPPETLAEMHANMYRWQDDDNRCIF